MGKPTGFLEYQRLTEAAESVDARVKGFKEFVLRLSDEETAQQGARCMDCGIPFCNNGCPVNNIIRRSNWRPRAKATTSNSLNSASATHATETKR